jgi:uncharacterized repeat protein (TIGR02543 family)
MSMRVIKSISTALALALVVTLVSPLVGFLPKAQAATVTASGSGSSFCDQIVGNASGITAVRSGTDCIITFTNVGTTTWTVPTGVTRADVLVVGGGGGGGGDGGSGGGGGEIRRATQTTISSNSVTVTIGGGGSGGSWFSSTVGTNGGVSTLSGGLTFTANGGVGGPGWTSTTGGAGGSGGSGGTGTNGQRGGGGPGGCPGTGLNFGTSPSGSAYSDSISGTAKDYGGGGGGGLGAQTKNTGTAQLGRAGGGSSNGGRGANYKIAVDGTTTIDGASAGQPGFAATGGGGGAGSACDARGDMNLGFDGVSQRTAGGNGGSGVVVIRYAIPVPDISLSITSFSATVGTAISSYSISNTASAVTSYSISPALPAGLSFNISTGLISGTPTTESSSQTYTVTATNSAGSDTATFTLGVTPLAPGAPTITSITAGSSTTLNVSFTAPTYTGGSIITGYRVERSTDGSNWTLASDAIAANATSYSVTGLTAGTAYYVRIAAKYSGGLGAWGYHWRKIYETTTPQRDSNNNIVYTSGFGLGGSDAAAQNASTAFTRVRYEMGSTYGGQNNYVYADFARALASKTSNSSEFSIANLRVPTIGGVSANQFAIHGNVSDLTIQSNVTDIQNGSGFSGRLEIWPWDYQTNPALPYTERTANTYDDADSYIGTGSGSYGSFQLHRISGVNQTIFAWNRHVYSLSSQPEIGFGNHSGNIHSDWTFAYVVAGYANSRSNFSLGIFINAPTTTTTAFTITYAAGTGGSGSAPTSPVTVDNGSTFTTPANTFTRTDYVFAGWSDGTNTYAAGATYPVSGTVSGNVTLTATWTAQSCVPSSTTVNGYTVLSFTTVGDCNWNVPAGVTSADVLVVGGGGGGAGAYTPLLSDGAGAGGGGGAYLASSYPVSGTIAITVGAGGAGGTAGNTRENRHGTRGGSSVFGSVTAGGGGGGGCSSSSGNNVPCSSGSQQHGGDGTAGGGGGGASNYWNAYNWGLGGTGSSVTVGSTTFTGQSGFRGSFYNDGGSSIGGSAGAGGGARSNATITARGSGLTSNITGSNQVYGLGGGAYGVTGWTFNSVTSGYGTGGDGARDASIATAGANGGQGVVIVKYANALTITYNANGGTTPTGGDSTTQTGATISSLATTSRTGYTFNGWFTASSGGTQITTSSPHGRTANFTLFAQWSSTLAITTPSSGLTATFGTSYTLNISSTGGSGSNEFAIAAGSLPAGLSLNSNTGVISGTPSAVGSQTIAVRVTDGSSSSVTTSSFTITVASIAALNPAFGTPTATSNGFTVQISNYDALYTWSGTATAGGSVSISNTGLVTVTGVAANTSSTATITTTRTNYSNGSGTVSATSIASYSISYAAGTGGSGSGPTSPLTVNAGTTFTTPANTFARTGYTFAGWNDGTNTYAAGATYPASGTVSGNVTLTATWTANTYTITFNKGSSATGADQTLTKTHDSALTLPNSATANSWFTRTNQTVAGWSTTDGDVLAFALGGSFTTNSATTLYPVWVCASSASTVVSSGLVLHLDAGNSCSTGTSGKWKDISGNQRDLTWVNAPSLQTSDGKFFDFDRSSNHYGTLTSDGLSNFTTGVSATFYAKFDSMGVWERIIDIGNGANQNNIWIGRYFNTNDLRIEIIQNSSSKLVCTAAGVLSSNWTHFGVTVDTQGNCSIYVNGVSQTVSRVINGSAPFVALDVQRTSNFVGKSNWPDAMLDGGIGDLAIYNKALSAAEVATNFSAQVPPSSDANLNALTISTGTLSPNFVATTTSYAVSVANTVTSLTVTPTRSNIGASITVNGSSVNSGSASSAINLSVGSNTITIIVTASDGTTKTYTITVTRLATVTVTFDKNDGSNATSTQSISISTATNLTSNSFTRTGYTFAGWSTTANGSVEYANGASITLNADDTLYAVWTANTYTITLTKGTTGIGSNQTLTKTHGINLTLPNSATANSYFTRVGYTVSGFSTTDGGAQTHALSGAFTTDAATTLYPVWSIDTYVVTFNSKDGSAVSNGSFTTSGTVSEPTAPTRTGFTFAGWSATDGGSAVNFPYSPNVTQNITLFARWTANSYVVTFNSKDGSAVANGSFTTGGTVSQPTNPVRAGYTFAGWSATDGGSAVNFPYSPNVTQNITLFARWTANSITVTFNKNDGSGNTTTQSLTADSATNLTNNSFTRTGYTFAGWSANNDGTGTQYSNGQSVTLLLSTTIYAKWTANTLTVTFNKNDGSGTTSTQSITAGTSTNLTSNAFTRTGYTFAGWTANSDGTGTSYSNSQSVNLTSNLPLYAAWTAINYTVSYNTNSATGSAPTQAARTIGQTFSVAAATGLTRTGYSFGGWSDGSNTYQPGDVYTVASSNVTFIAQWNLDTYTITYSANGGTGSASRTTDSYIYGSAAIVLPGRGTLAKAGYSFAGWSTTNSGSAIVGNYTPTQTRTLYAVWSPNTYTISYNTNGATGSPSVTSENYTTGNAGSSLAGLGTMTKTGHEFVGWATAANGTRQTIVQTPFTTTESLTLYAVWDPFDYTISYDLNGGSGTAPTQVNKFYNQTFTLAAAATRADNVNPAYSWAFVAWSDGINQYQAGSTYRVGTSNITLTAVWIRVFTVKYTMNGADTAAPADVFSSAQSSVVLASAPSRAGYTFTGWKDQSGQSYNAGATMTVDIDSYLVYAQWSPIDYTVSYALMGGTSTQPSGATVNIGDQVTVAANPTRAGHRFNGWSYNSQLYGAGAVLVVGTSDISFSANWTAISYSITYDMNGSTTTRPTVSNRTIGQTFFTAATPSRAGYTFAGWSDGSQTLAAGAQYTVGSSDITLTATWSAVNYSLTYDVNGGNSQAPSGANNLNIGGTFTVATAPTHQNRTFLGWSDGSNTYTPGQTYTVGSGNITLSALWSGVNYNITYDLNGGSGSAPTESAKETGQSITVKNNNGFNRANYTFNGWKLGQQAVAAGDSLSVGNSDITLVAQWTPAFTVSFNANGGSATSDLTFTGNALARPTNPTRANFVFEGWTDNGNDVSWPYTPSGPVNLQARWTQLSLYGISPSDLTRFGQLTKQNGVAASFRGSNASSSVAVDVPAGALPDGTNIYIDLVGNTQRARNLISAENSYLVSFVVSWLATDGTVPTTTAGNPITMTINNAEIKAGAVIYSVVGDTYTVLGRATQDGTATIEIIEDPEILVAATKPDAPTNVTGSSSASTNLSVSWTAPAINGGSAITGYTATTNAGQSCTTNTTSCTINGLTADTSYTVTVIATNSIGNSVASTASAAIRTAAVQNQGGGGGGGGGGGNNNNGGGSGGSGGSGNSGGSGGSGNSGGSTPVKETPTKPVTQTGDGKPVVNKPGEGKRIVDGVVKTELVRVVEKTIVRTEFNNVAIEVKSVTTNNQPKPLTNETTLVFEQAGKAALAGTGFKPVTKVLVWLFSDPTLLGETEVKADGSFDVLFLVPASLPAGNHTLQINGVTNANEVITQTMGVIIEAKATPEEPKPTTKRVLNLSMLATAKSPTNAQLAKVKKVASNAAAGSVITCNAYVAATKPTKAQQKQAQAIAARLCAPAKANSALTTKLTKTAPADAGSLKWAKRKPIRVEVVVTQPVN